MYTDMFYGKPELGYAVDDAGYYHVYEVPTADDVQSVPNGIDMEFSLEKPRPGSKCIVAENGALFTLTADRAWTLMIQGDS